MDNRKRKKGTIFDDYYSRADDVWTCRNCKKFSKKIDTAKVGTGSLSNHLKHHHKEQFKEYQKKSNEKKIQEPPEKIIKPATTDSTRQMKIDEPKIRPTDDSKSKTIDRAILEFLAAAALPLSLVDNPAFRRLIHLMDSRYHLRNRKYFGSTLLDKCVADVKEKIKKELQQQPHITLDLDEWSNNAQTHSLIGVSAHFLDENFKNKHFILGAKALKMPKDEEGISTKKKKTAHSADNMAKIVEELIKELNLYFQAPTIPRDASPAAYWKLHETVFPHLTALFKKYGTAPATSAEVERLFSLAGNIVTDLRKRLGVERLEKLLFLNANLPLLKI
uniref:HAT C-terminal dimerisation domain-containing protein n=1 Tax=Panagrolaimus davidi TaxID=227884 RepID=A0A914QF20_9BILA